MRLEAGGGVRTTEIFDFGSFFGWEKFGKYCIVSDLTLALKWFSH